MEITLIERLHDHDHFDSAYWNSGYISAVLTTKSIVGDFIGGFRSSTLHGYRRLCLHRRRICQFLVLLRFRFGNHTRVHGLELAVVSQTQVPTHRSARTRRYCWDMCCGQGLLPDRLGKYQ